MRLSVRAARSNHRPVERRPAHGGGRVPVVGRVTVLGGYRPSVIHVCAAPRLALVFRREESAQCSERVVFPSLGRSVSLPANRDTPIVLTIPGPGVYEFTCAMGVLRGRLVVHGSR